MLVLAGVLPVTLVLLAAAGWYIATGETPVALLRRLASAPHIAMAMPPRPGGGAPAALIRPPASNESDVKVTMAPVPPPAPAANPSPPAPPPMAAPPPQSPPPANAAPPATGTAAGPSAGPNPPAAGAASNQAATPPAQPQQAAAAAPPPPPPPAEPLAPPAGEPLAAPSFAQLPTRNDLKPLQAAPVAALLRDSPYGPLPIAGEGGKEARTVYARPFSGPKGPRVGVVVVGLGLSKEATEAAILRLPPEIDLSFSPYASGLDNWVKKARASGHEVLLDLPLEPPNYPTFDAGPLAIMARASPAQAVDGLQTVLGRATGYVGLAAMLHSPVAAGSDWLPLLREIKGRGLLLVGDGLSAVAPADAPAFATVALVADERPFRAAIDVRLAELLAAAQREGSAVAYVSPRPVTFERLLAWAASLPQKGAALAPVSALVRAPAP